MNDSDLFRLAAGGTGGILAVAWLLRMWLSARGLLRHDAAGEHTAEYYMQLIRAQHEEIERLRAALAACEQERAKLYRGADD